MWTEFLAACRFEALVRELSLLTLAEARRAWAPATRVSGFAFNCNSAYGDLHISLACDPARARGWEPPDWEYECAEDSLHLVRAVWRDRYGPVRDRYEAETVLHPGYPAAFLHSLRRVLIGLELDGAFREYPGIRSLVTEVDADTRAEEAALDELRQAMMRDRASEHPRIQG
jgi:hypothetical protein